MKPNQVDKIAKAVEKSIFPEAAQFGTISGFIDNDDIKKIYNTYTGHAYDLMIRSTIYEGVLSITKALEKNGSSLSLFCDGLSDKAKMIEEKRRTAHPDWDDMSLNLSEISSRIKTLNKKVTNARNSAEFVNLKVFRDTNLAHRLDIEQRIEKLRKDGHEYSAPTYRNILDLGKTIVELSAESVSIWSFKTIAWQDVYNRYEGYTRNIFEHLPKIK